MKKTDPVVLKNAYASIFKGEMGKIVMNDLKTWCHVGDTPFHPDKQSVTDFNCGKQFIFFRICKMSNIDLNKFMNKELSE